MDISFILTSDEIFTLMSLLPDRTEGGERFAAEALPDAKQCDLSSLADKKLAKLTNGELELAPVIRMMADAIARADSVEAKGDIWNIDSPWVSLRCEKYLYQDGCWKITPLGEEE